MLHCSPPPPSAAPTAAAAASLRRFLVSPAVWNRGVTVAADETRNEGGAPQHFRSRANVEAGQALVAGRVIEHGHTNLLHDTVWSQSDGLKRAEVHEGYLRSTVQGLLGAYGTQGTVEEELRTLIPH